jgi:hypothetical protein
MNNHKTNVLIELEMRGRRIKKGKVKSKKGNLIVAPFSF